MELLVGRYTAILVALSFVISVFGSYTALQLAYHVPSNPGDRERPFWLAAAAFAMGAGAIWSMHFIGMAAFDLGLPVRYDLTLTVASLVIAVAATGAGFAVVCQPKARTAHIVTAGVLMGAGVVGMHYSGMAAMRTNATLSYAPLLVVLSALIAVLASTVALWLVKRSGRGWQTVASSVVTGVGVCGMHYTGMAAARFRPGRVGVGEALPPLTPEFLAYGVFLLTLVVLSMGLAVAVGQREDLAVDG